MAIRGRREIQAYTTLLRYLALNGTASNATRVSKIEVNCDHGSHGGAYVPLAGNDFAEIFACSGIYWTRFSSADDVASPLALGPDGTPARVLAHLFELSVSDRESASALKFS